MEAGFEPAPVRRAARQPNRDAVRETSQYTPRKGAVVVEGRNGEILTRRRTQVGDQFHVPSEEIPENWSYQWNPVTVHNQEVIDQQNLHHANGWRPVPASRHPGRWTRPGHTGDIVVGGLRLEERPEALTREALLEEKTKALRQIRDQAKLLKLPGAMPDGFVMGRQHQQSQMRGAKGGIHINVDDAMDAPRPSYSPPDDSIT